MSTPPPKLLDYAREVLRARHYAYRTEQSYIDWMRRLFSRRRQQEAVKESVVPLSSFDSIRTTERKLC